MNYEKEEGIDAGGLSREWSSLIFKEFLDPMYGLFVESKNKITLQPSPLSHFIPEYKTLFRFLNIFFI